MKIAILGRQPAIGIAELESIFGGESLRVLGQHAALVEAERLNISHFGSILKSGKVAFEVNSIDWREVSKKIVEVFVRDFSNFDGKITLGISAYDLPARPSDISKTGAIIKQKLKKSGVSVRTIQNKDLALSTAVSHNNKLGLSEKKIEILAVRGGKKTVIALSEGAQNITTYARRDQNRPKRDAFVGMLPPKLAQTMVNLAAGANQPQISRSKMNGENSNQAVDAFQSSKYDSLPTRRYGRESESRRHQSSLLAESSHIEKHQPPQLLDPFCGTGTVLQEAILKGFTAHGTDLSDKMISFSKENIDWLLREFRPFGDLGELRQADATIETWEFAKNLTTVACETYLGQPFSAPPSPKKLAEVRENCNRIISNFLKNLASQIPEDTQICIAVPAWRTQTGEFSHLPLVDFLNELGYNRKEFMRVKNRDLIYFRENQVVARELLVLIRSKNVKS